MSIGFDTEEPASTEEPRRPRPKSRKPEALQAAPPADNAAPSVHVQLCPTHQVECEKDPDRVGWVRCPNRCGFRVRVYTGFRQALQQQARAREKALATSRAAR